ncbi:MAG: aspartate/glutamate racemase family protein [Pseudomonadota bacterium]|nr:aspartate/glutamate racemase family protein [Pseudomonadota bacterium]
MKTIGLLGGMSWESTVSYYRALNEGVRARLGGLHSAKVVLYSVEFAEIERLQHAGDWAATAEILAAAAQRAEAAGADFLLLCTNTMHKIAPEIECDISIPLLHIADATGDRLQRQGIQTAGLLGTRFTMEQPFYRKRLEERFGIRVLTPEAADRALIHEVIYEELCHGRIEAASREDYLRIISELAERGAEGVILGCTEIALLVCQQDTKVPLFDTTRIHAEAAVELALGPD